MNIEQISIYFSAEKSAGFLLFIFGITVVLISLYFLIKVKKPFYNGLAISLVSIALIQTLAGLTVYYTSDQDVA